MDLLHRFKAKYYNRVAKKYVKTIKRRQLNFNCDEHIISGVKFLAVVLEVPVYVIGEHLLQVGCYHILAVIRDEDIKRRLTEHLVKTHLLGDKPIDDEDILRLGDN